VRRLRHEGMRVAALDVDGDRVGAVDADAHVVADVTREDDAGRGIDEAAAALGGLDVVVACAGVAGRGTVETTSLEEWERVFAVNVRGVYLTAKAAIPHLREAGGGSIVVVASQLGLVAAANAAAYCASKGAAVMLTRAIAVDHGGEGIRATASVPGRLRRRCSSRTSRSRQTRTRNRHAMQRPRSTAA
jgi:NAD(P)-dependent dehydrogenase (short-subunit alcohol dehydrogenase family)